MDYSVLPWIVLVAVDSWPRQESIMPSPPRDPAVDDVAPTASVLTAYDEGTRSLTAPARRRGWSADWKEVARIVLCIDPAREPGRARHETHLTRARWMTERGYQHLLQGGDPH